MCDFLARQGIPAAIFGDYLAGAAGELPAGIWPAVWVLEDEDLPRARALLQEFLAEAVAPVGPEWCCAGCGEWMEGGFELCWRCGRSRE